MNHEEYAENLKHQSMGVLTFICKDAAKALDAMPDGENALHYIDEIFFISMEIKRRILLKGE